MTDIGNKKRDYESILALQKDSEIEQLHLRLQEAAKLNMELMEIRHSNETKIKHLLFIIEQADYFMDPKTAIHWHNFIKQYENLVPSI